MSCCSGQRSAARSSPMLRAAAAVAQPKAVETSTVIVRYTGTAPLALRGPFSGLVYRVGATHRAIEVDPRDLEALLRTGLFERSGRSTPG
jgi:hypothetical protein